MPRTLATILALALLAALAPAAPADVATRGKVAERLRARLAAARVPADRVGVAVITRGPRPEVVFVHDHNAVLRPASVAKVFTAATALDLLGPAHVFTTTITARGALLPDGTLEGDLVVHGSGDPNLSGRLHDGDPLRLLDAFAAAVVKQGVKRVTGALVLDDGPLDRAFVHPSWTSGDRAAWYGAGVAGLAFNDGCADLVVRGADGAGRAAQVEAASTLGPWALEERVGTTAGGDTTVGAVWVGTTALRVQGSIPVGATYRFAYPVPDPLAFFGEAFARRLAHAGVVLERGVRPAQDDADRRRGERVLLQHGSALDPTLAVMNRRSQNFYAAMIFKAAGAAALGRGTWESGERAVATMLARRGLDPERRTRIVDGSGLSHDNRTTAATIARLLVVFEQDLLRGPALLGSLAVPGEEGSLERRLRSGDLPRRLHAKTGTLGRSGVHALAGYLDGSDPADPGLAFAILVDTPNAGRALIDELVQAMARP